MNNRRRWSSKAHDTDTDILATIFARVSASVSWNAALSLTEMRTSSLVSIVTFCQITTPSNRMCCIALHRAATRGSTRHPPNEHSVIEPSLSNSVLVY